MSTGALFRSVVAGIAFGAVTVLAQTDVLVLKDGRRLTGNVSMGPNAVVLQVNKQGSALQFFEPSEVARIVKGVDEADLPPEQKQAQPEAKEPASPQKPMFPTPALPKPQIDLEHLSVPKLPGLPAGSAAKGGLLAMALAGFMILGGVLHVVGRVMILVDAFQAGVGQGLLCLCIDVYLLYYAIALYDADSKTWGRLFYFGGLGLMLIGWAAMFGMGMNAFS